MDHDDESSVHMSTTRDSYMSNTNRSDGLSQPDQDDIICGRGKSIAHKGNARFRQLVNSKKDEYQRARRREDKTRLTTEIVLELKKTSRFLLKDPKLQLWFEVGEDYIKEKVSHALRSRSTDDRRKRPKPIKKCFRRQELLPAVDEAVESLLQEQQELLKTMIEREGGNQGARFSFLGD